MSDSAEPEKRLAPGTRERLVCILCPGGLEHSGGIGRVMGYVIDTWSGDERSPVTRVIDTRGAGSIVLAPLYFVRALASIVLLRWRGRVRILHVNLSSHGSTVRKSVVMAVAALLGVPAVIHLHGSRFDVFYRGLSPLSARVVRWMFRRAGRVIVLGRYWREFVVSEIGIPDTCVETVFNGVPDPGPALRSPAGGSPVSPHIIFLGRLGQRKGVPELISALGILAREGRMWRATLAGDGPVETYRDQVRDAGIADRVRLPGWVDRRGVDQLLSEADIVVLPSYQENQPMSVIEGLAHGLAVVTTPVGALPDILVNEQNSLIVAPGDIEGLAGALRRLIDDPLFRVRIAGKGRDTFADRLDIRIAAARLAAIYDEVDSSKRSNFFR